MLQDLCSQVDVADNGRKAVAAFASHISDDAFDLILMDCQMPEMDGFAATSVENRAIVSAIILLAHSLNLRVVAEGVETEEQAKFLRSLQCDQMQGYLFSPPVSSERIEAHIQKSSAPPSSL